MLSYCGYAMGYSEAYPVTLAPARIYYHLQLSTISITIVRRVILLAPAIRLRDLGQFVL